VTQHHYDQQPTFGFRSVIYLGETQICVPLHDPTGIIATLKAEVAVYPRALKGTIIADSLGCTEFTLVHAYSFAAGGDIYNTVGCLTRIANYLTQALFALNERYFLGDKGALREIDGFALQPAGYSDRITTILGAPGVASVELRASVQGLQALWREVVELGADHYLPRFGFDMSKPNAANPLPSAHPHTH
jgi:hypothetical protein